MANDPLEPLAVIPRATKDRLALARVRLRQAAERGARILMYELALELDMSEYHFAREFRSAFGLSPHAFYDEARAACARDLLQDGLSEGVAARKIGLRRPAELRRLLRRRSAMRGIADVRAGERQNVQSG